MSPASEQQMTAKRMHLLQTRQHQENQMINMNVP